MDNLATALWIETVEPVGGNLFLSSVIHTGAMDAVPTERLCKKQANKRPINKRSIKFSKKHVKKYCKKYVKQQLEIEKKRRTVERKHSPSARVASRKMAERNAQVRKVLLAADEREENFLRISVLSKREIWARVKNTPAFDTSDSDYEPKPMAWTTFQKYWKDQMKAGHFSFGERSQTRKMRSISKKQATGKAGQDS